MTDCTATVSREGRWWVAEVSGVGATQARRLSDLRSRVADLVATARDCEPEEIGVDFEIRLPDEVAAELERAATLRAQAAAAQREAALAVSAAATRLRDEGVSTRDIGTALGVSAQRAHQLLNRPHQPLNRQ